MHNLKKFLDRQGIHYTTKNRKDTLVFKLLEYKKSEDLAKKLEDSAKKSEDLEKSEDLAKKSKEQ